MNEDIWARQDFYEQHQWWVRARYDIIPALAQFRSLPPGARILDIGPGASHFAKRLLDAGYDVHVVDSEARAVEAARAKGIRAVSLADAGHLPCATGEYDAVVALDVLEHVEDEAGALREVRRVLKPGGYFFATVPAHQQLFSNQDQAAGHVRRYSRRALVARVGAHLTVVRVSYYLTLLAPIAYPVRVIKNIGSRLFGVRFPTNELDLAPRLWGFFYRLMMGEKWLLQHIDLPFGMSLIVVGRKPDAADRPPRR